MKRTVRNIFAGAALLALGATSSIACPLAYTINFIGQFGLVDLATGVFTPIGKGLDNTPDGIAGAPGGPFYTVDGVTGHLLRIENDGKVTDVGDTHTGPNMGPNGISVMGSLLDGTLYALDFSNRLYHINAKTAALTLVAYLPTLAVQVPQYDGNMTTSLNGTADKLIFTIEISDGPEKIGPNVYVIDLDDLSVKSYALKVTARIIGSGFVNVGFYLFSEAGDIVKFDVVTHETTLVSNYDSGLTPDGPPITGIFGVIGPMEPNTLVTKPPVSPKTAERSGRGYWPAKSAALPRPLVCQ
jgi:hypothetical protein